MPVDRTIRAMRLGLNPQAGIVAAVPAKMRTGGCQDNNMKRPDPSMLVGGSAASAAVAAVCLGVGQLEQAGKPQPDIWSNGWVLGAIIISAIAVITTVVSIAIGIFGRSLETAVTDRVVSNHSADTNIHAVNSATNQKARIAPLRHGEEVGSQDDVKEKPASLTEQLQLRKEWLVPVAALPALAIAIVGIFTITSNVDGGDGGFFALSPDTISAEMPQECTKDGPVVFVVSGRQASPAPALVGSAWTAAVNAVHDGSAVGLVDLDGRPRLVAADVFSTINQSTVIVKAEQTRYFYS